MKNKAIFAALILTSGAVSFMLGTAFGRKSVLTTVMLPDNDSVIPSGTSIIEVETQQITGILNINTATKEDLILLPGIGDVLAQAIIDYRETNGPFTSTEELLEISGIGNKKLDSIIEYISVGG